MEIKINKIEQLTGKDSGNPYWKLETSKGNMSCFDKEIADRLWKGWTAQEIVYVDAIPSKDEKYVNIRRIFDTKEENDAYEEVSRNYEATHPFTQANRDAVTVKPQDLGKVPAMGPDGKIAMLPEIKNFNPTSMYVSYVKDLVVSGKTKEEAVEIVKYAHKEFS